MAPRSSVVRRRTKPPPAPTEWWHVVLAMFLTLAALASWASAYGNREGVGLSVGAGTPGTRDDQAEEGPPRSFSIAAAGDILVHGPVYARASQNAGGDGYDFRPMFQHVAPVISDADVGICHVETPISPDNSGVSSFPIFNAPREIAQAAVAAGFDLCSTASNHSFDKGPEGVAKTLRVLRAAGLRTEGTATGRREARRPELLDVNGVRVGHLSYTYGLNGFVLPTGRSYLVNVIKARRILKEAQRAREQGAEFVVVSLHWGQEFVSEPTPQQIALARRLLRSPEVDLILGHHAHVPQPVRRFRGKPAVFGLGNLISNQRPGATATCCPAASQDGLVVTVRVHESKRGWRSEIEYLPTWVRPGTFEILPVPIALRDPRHADVAAELLASWKRTISIVGRTRSIRPTART